MIDGTRPEKGKTLRASNGKRYRVTSVLVCREGEKERTARCLVHTHGWVEFAGRSYDHMPRQKFQHIKSKVR